MRIDEKLQGEEGIDRSKLLLFDICHLPEMEGR
jgi:hypothetical protein